MKTKIPVVLLITFLLLTAVPFSFAQTSPTDWDALRQFPAGTELFIKTSDHKTFIGSLAVVSDEAIELTVKQHNIVLTKNNLKAIYFAVPKTGRRARNIGALIGAVIGVAAYVAAARDEGESAQSAPIIPFFAGGIAGDFVGSLFGKGKKKGALIYEAK